MKRITQRSIALSITLMLAFATVAMSAPKSERSSKYIMIEGRVLHLNRDARTLLVCDSWSKKLYLITVPAGEAFQITFGTNSNYSTPGFEQVRRNDRVRMRCTRDANKEHLARLADGREVVMLNAAN